MKLATKIGQVIKLNLMNIIRFEALYRFLTIPLYLQMIDRGLKMVLKASGYSYVTAANLAEILLVPWTWLFLAAAGLVGLFFLAVEIGALVTAYQGTVYLRKVPPYEMLAGGLHKVADECGKGNWKLFFLLAGNYILVNLFLLYRVLSHVKPVNFVMEELLGTRFGTPFLFAAFLILAAVLLPGVFAPYFSMVEQKSFADSWWNSRQLMKGRGKSVVGILLAGNVCLLLAAVLFYLLAVAAAAVAVTVLVKRSLQLAVLSGLAGQIELAVLLLYSIFISVLNLGMVTVIYYHYQERRLEENSWQFSGRLLGRGARRKLLLSGAAFGAVSGLFLFDLVYNGSRAGDGAFLEIQITAHRGSSKTAPENTMAAVKAAVEELADFVELDVQETLDGVLVLCHDTNLSRLAGVNRRVSELTLAELSELDVGSWFSEEFAGEKIPELRKVMEYAKGRIKLNLELKNLGDDTSLPEQAAALVAELGMEEQCVISSARMRYLERVKAANPDIHTGYIVAAAYGNYYANDCLDFISIRSSFVNREFVGRAHGEGKAVHAWTVNSAAELEQMKLAGVDNIITDYPVKAREICFREEATENLLEYLRMVFR